MSAILIIEDEQHVADLIKQSLEEEGYKVLHASDGLKGIELIKTTNIQLVILDILLPKMNGLEVCRQIRNNGYNELLVLILTALGSAENIVLGFDTGADDYLAKPFKLIELKARIKNLLRRSEFFDVNGSIINNIYKFADLELNDYTKKVTRNNNDISHYIYRIPLAVRIYEKPH